MAEPCLEQTHRSYYQVSNDLRLITKDSSPSLDIVKNLQAMKAVRLIEIANVMIPVLTGIAINLIAPLYPLDIALGSFGLGAAAPSMARLLPFHEWRQDG